MKPLTKKLLESGIVEKNFAIMLERWGSLDPGAADEVKSRMVKQRVEEFVDELDEIIESNMEPKETRIDIVGKGLEVLYCPTAGVFSAALDEMGRLIIPTGFVLQRGDNLWKNEPGRVKHLGPWARVLDVEPLHIEETLVGYQVTIEELPQE